MARQSWLTTILRRKGNGPRKESTKNRSSGYGLASGMINTGPMSTLTSHPAPQSSALNGKPSS